MGARCCEERKSPAGESEGVDNVADHLTKGKAVWEFRGLLESVGGRIEGRVCEGRREGSRRAMEDEDGDGECGEWGVSNR